MSYVESYVTTGAGASDVNGGGPQLGALDGPIYAATSVSSTLEIFPYYILSDDAGTPWPGVQVGDQLCYDPAGTKPFARVVEINYFGVPADIRVYGTTGELTGKACNVGGAFATPKAAIAAIETMQAAFANGIPPRLNIKGDYTIDSTITLTVTWTKTKPLIVQGYAVTPGDRPVARPILTVDTNIQGVDLVLYDYTLWADLHFKRTYNGAAALFNASSELVALVRCRLEATVGTGSLFTGADQCRSIQSEFVNSGTATGTLVDSLSISIGCYFEGGQINNAVALVVSSRFVNAYITGMTNFIVNALIEPPASQDAVSFNSGSITFGGVINSIVQGVSGAGKAALQASAVNLGTVIEMYNDLYNNVANIGTNIANPIDGQGDITTDPNLDVNDRPQAGSGALGAGTPSYIDIGWGQKQEAGGGGGILVHPGMSGGTRG